MTYSTGVALVQHADAADRILSLAVSADGNMIASSGALQRIYFWNVANRTSVKMLRVSESEDWGEGITDMAFHRRHAFFCFIEPAGTVCVKSTDTGRCLLQLADSENNAVVFALHHQYPQIIYGCLDSSIVLYDIAKNITLSSHRPFAIDHTQAYELWNFPVSVSISPDARYVSSVFRDGTGLVLAVPSCIIVHEFREPDVALAYGAFSNAQSLFVTVTKQGEFRSYDTRDWTVKHSMKSDVSKIWRCNVSPTTSICATTSCGKVLIWNYSRNTLECITDIDLWELTPLCFAHDGRSLFVGCQDRYIRRFELADT